MFANLMNRVTENGFNQELENISHDYSANEILSNAKLSGSDFFISI